MGGLGNRLVEHERLVSIELVCIEGVLILVGNMK